MATTTVKGGGGEGAGVEGLNAFRKELRLMDKALPKEMAKINRTFSERVATDAKSRAASFSPVARHFSDGIFASGRGTAVFVGIDSKRAAGIFGAEFGGGTRLTPAGGSTLQFGPHRGKRGGPFWAAIRAKGPELKDEYWTDVQAISKPAFPD
jgi:hypothetical protein